MNISPSICTGGYADVIQTLKWLKEKGADRIHIDIMDGRYVRSIMGGTDYVNMIRQAIDLPLELHFMCLQPERFLEMYQIHAGELIYIHADSTNHPHRLLQTIHAKGARTGLVLAVTDQPECAEELLDQTDEVLIMGVETGCPAVAFQWSVLEKVNKIRDMAAARGINLPIQIDGSVSPSNICELVRAGVDSVVLGYPGCFDPIHGREYTLNLMLKLIRETEQALQGEKK